MIATRPRRSRGQRPGPSILPVPAGPRARAASPSVGGYGPNRDPRDRPGHDRHDLPRLRRDGSPPAAPTASSPSTSRGRVGRARRRRDLGRDRAVAREALDDAGVGPDRRHRHHQPARDRLRLGPERPASRCTTRSSGRTAAPPSAATSCARQGHETSCHAQRPRPRPVLQRDEDRVAARQRRRPARAGERRPGGLRHGRRLAGLQAHRRAP